MIIASRMQAADANSPGIIETLGRSNTVMADVEPIGPLTFYAAEQVDTPVTHRITIRWLDWVDTTCVVFRKTQRLDDTNRYERFRVRRVMEVDGRKRFLRMDVELEQRG